MSDSDSKGNVHLLAEECKQEDKNVNIHFAALGHHDQVHYFYGKRSKNLVRLTNFSPAQLLMLAPKEYWVSCFPAEKAQMNTFAATDFLIKRSLAIGPFNVSKVRGTGVWLDAGRVVINTGDRLLVNEVRTDFDDLDSRFHYVQTANKLPFHPRPLSADEGADLQYICAAFQWKNKKTDPFLIAGWLMIARIAGALPIRPHIWITGGKGTGKSTLLEMLVNPCLGDPEGRLYLQGASTEAGIRQSLGISSMPIVFDEFETTDDKASGRRISNVLELVRSSWSQTSGRIRKGTPSGTATDYALSFAACFSSIRVKVDNDADESRISVLELTPHGNKTETWESLCGKIKDINEALGERLFARACQKLPEVLATFKIMAQALAGRTSQRYGQQVGMLLAGAWMLQNDEVITKEEAEVFAAVFVEETDDSESISDEEACLNRLLTWKVEVAGRFALVGDILVNSDGAERKALGLYGIRCEGQCFIVANNHSQLEGFYAQTRWDKHWNKALRRLPGAEYVDTKSFGSRGCKSRGVSIPLAVIEAG